MSEKKRALLSGALERHFGPIFSWAPDGSAQLFYDFFGMDRTHDNGKTVMFCDFLSNF